jgi:hypothetical protein
MTIWRTARCSRAKTRGLSEEAAVEVVIEGKGESADGVEDGEVEEAEGMEIDNRANHNLRSVYRQTQ